MAWRRGAADRGASMDPDRHQEIARCLFRESNDALFLFDPADNRVVDANPAAQRLTDMDKAELCALRVFDLFRSPEADDLAPLIDAYRRTGFFHSREDYELRRAGGLPPLPVNLSVSRIHTRPDPLGLVVARDISERRAAQAALDRVFRLAPDLIGVARGGRFEKLNPAWEAALGTPADALLATPTAALVHPDDPDAFAPIADGQARELENRLRHHDGTDRWIAWRAVGDAGAVVAVGRDLTDRHRAAEEARRADRLQRATLAAEAASAAKSQFLASISHEIRTPMTAILGFTELLLEDPRLASAVPERAEDLRTIRQSGLHLLALINDLLDLSEIEAGKLRVIPGPCSPASLAAEVAASLRGRAEAKGLALGVEFKGAVPEAIATDAGRLRQILINLVGNAVKFTAEGSVTLRLGPGGPGPGGPSLRFDVVDTGVGVGPEELGRLFEPFYRGAAGTADAPGGTGLGLAISRRLAEALGGTISVQSTPGLGSTFGLTLPLGPPTAPPGTDPPRPPAPASLAGRILLAEDNEAVRRVVTLRLQAAGATVVVARHGREALDLALAARETPSPFDAILMDMQMPVLDGYEATRQLRAAGLTTPIVALTAYAMAEDREECLRFGCDDHVSKPVDWEQLSRVLGRLLGRR